MSNRNLMHYFSPSAISKPLHEDDTRKSVEIVNSPKKCHETSTEELLRVDDDDDDILPNRNENSIKRYFEIVDKEIVTKRASRKLCLVTVEAQVHPSPKKEQIVQTFTKHRNSKKRKKKKTGIPSSQADIIEVISSEELVTDSSSSPPPEENHIYSSTITKLKGNMKICLEETKKTVVPEAVEVNEGIRRSSRLKNKTVQSPCDDFIDDELENLKKRQRRKKRDRKDEKGPSDEEEIQIVSEEIAPIFTKKKRQEEFRATKKAKQEFLFSGVPEVLKQQVSVQLAMEQRPVEIFPKISHVTQTGSEHRQLPYPQHLNLILKPLVPKQVNRPTTFPSSLNSPMSADAQLLVTKCSPQKSPLEWRHCKDWISGLKEDHNVNFPFYRALKSLLSKSSAEYESLWTDAYAPTQSAEIFGNRLVVQQLKHWLNQWKLRAGEDVTISPKKKSKPKGKSGKRKRIDSDGTDFDEGVEDRSNSEWSAERDDGEDQLWTCVLVTGPAGCGKTASVYALAQELGFNVLEVNASSKRNGKSVLSHLHEATQSHSLMNGSSNSSAASGLSKLFGNKTAAKQNKTAVKPEDSRPPLSLVLFEDVDIVFEPEDDSFYSAISTLINTTKRPIILTLGSKHERALAVVQEKIKSPFNVLQFDSPDIQTACGYLWSVCIARGYPVDWNALEEWLAIRTGTDLDLRALLLDLQMKMEHHPLRVKLSFTQLQLKAEDSGGGKRLLGALSAADQAAPIERIKCFETTKKDLDWSYGRVDSNRFAYDADQSAIHVVASRKKRFSRILLDDSLVDSDSNEENVQVTAPSRQEVRWKGDLTPLSRCFEYRAVADVLRSFVSSSQVSWNDASLLNDVEEMIVKHSSKLVSREIDFSSQESLPQSRKMEVMALKSTYQMMLHSCMAKSLALQRTANQVDVLPYLRTMVRCDLERSAGKRRRKVLSQCPSIRLPSLDLVLPTSAVIDLANAL